MELSPLVSPTTPVQDPTSSQPATPPASSGELAPVDFSKLPDKRTPMELAALRTMSVDPTHAADVIRLSGTLNQPPAVIDENLESAKQAAAIPSSEFFSKTTDQYPRTAEYLSDPNNMARAKDDIDNLTKSEGIIQNHSNLDRLWRVANSAAASTASDIFRLPATAEDIARSPGNLMLYMAHQMNMLQDQPEAPLAEPNRLSQFFAEKAAEWKPPPLAPYMKQIQAGDYSGIGQHIAEDMVENWPSLAVMAMSGGAGIGMMTEQSVSGGLERNRQAGIDPAMATMNAFYHGAFTAALMDVGVLGPFRKWGESLSNVVGPDAAKKIILSTFNAMGHSGAVMGTMMGGTNFLNDYADYATGVNPDALHGTLKRSAEAMVAGGLQGGVFGLVGASHGIYQRADNIRRTEQAQRAYLALGKNVEASKVYDRAPEMAEELLTHQTQGTPLERIGLPIQASDQYFQSKNVDPDEIYKQLGVAEQVSMARASGGDLNVPLAKMATVLGKTEHYAALKDDIRFNPDDATADNRTINELKARNAGIDKMIDKAAEAAYKDNPRAAEQQDTMFTHFRNELTKQGRPLAEATADAQLASKVIAGLGALYKMEPNEWLAQHPIRITNGTIIPEPTPLPPTARAAEATQTFVEQAVKKVKKPRILKQDIEARAFELANAEGAGYETRLNEWQRWKGIIGKGIKPPKEIGGQRDVYAEWKMLRPSFKHSDGRDNDVVAQEARAADLLGENEDLFQKLMSLEYPRSKPKMQDYLDRARYELESQHYQKFMQEAIPQGDLFSVEKQNAGERFARHLKTGRDMGMSQNEAQKYAMDKLAAESKQTIQNAVKAQQQEFGAGGVQGFGTSAKGEQELFQPAYHGTPHDVDQFKLQHIGTGQGAASYGWGLYFAGKKEVAENYREQLSGELITKNFRIGDFQAAKDERYLDYSPKDSTDYAQARASMIENLLIDQVGIDAAYSLGGEKAVKEHVLKAIDEQIKDWKTEWPEGAKALSKWRETVDKQGVKMEAEKPGNVYEVDIPEDEEFLSWDKTLSKQSKNVQESIAKIPEQVWDWMADQLETQGMNPIEPKDSTYTGQELYQLLTQYAAEGPLPGIEAENPSENASRYLSSLGLPGIQYLDQGSRDMRILSPEESASGKWTVGPATGAKTEQNFFDTQKEAEENFKKVATSNYVVFDDKLVKIVERYKQSQFQGDPETDPRGSIQFRGKEAIISMLNADPSTFPHEIAHYWLKNFHEFIQTGQGTETHLKDWGILKDWLGIKDEQTTATKEQQETFAKGFEQYLREGKAPSDDLRGVFAKFRKWLTRLYKDPSILGAPLSKNVKSVMDRIVASEDEISFAQRDMGMEHLFKVDVEGLDPKVQAKLDKLREAAKEEAINNLTRDQMKELSKENKEFLSSERAKAETMAEEKLRDNKELAAMDTLKQQFRRNPKDISQAYLNNEMSGGDRDAYEIASEQAGYLSADEMAKKIIDTPSRKEQRQKIIDDHMAQFADLKDRQQIKTEAFKAVHNDKSAELMALEAKIYQAKVEEASGRQVDIKQRAEQARSDAMAAKAKARDYINSMPVGQAGKFLPYFTAERNAALEAQKAASNKDYEAAAAAKQKQLVNHTLATESFKFRDVMTKALRLFDRYGERGNDLKGMQYGFIRIIDTVLGDRGLAHPNPQDIVTYRAIADKMLSAGELPDEIAHATGLVQDGHGQWKPESLLDFQKRIVDNYGNLNVPDFLVNKQAQHYRTMPVSDFLALKQFVKSVASLGRGYDNFLDEEIKTTRKAAATELREFIETNVGAKYQETRKLGEAPTQNAIKKTTEAIASIPDKAIPSLVSFFSICDALDAGDPNGPAKKYMYRILKRGGDTELTLNDSAVADMNAILNAHFKEDEFAKLKQESVYIKSLDRNLTKDQVLAYALNQGTAKNVQRVRSGYGITDEAHAEIMAHLEKRDFDFAQAVWDHMDKYWPDIVAQQQKVAGETPEKEPAQKVQTPFGEYRGGYYPLAYDYTKSNEAYRNMEARNALFKTNGSVMAHTEHGFTESRVENLVRPVRLDTNVMFNHLDDVIHDLSMRQPVIDVNRFLKQKDTREAISNAIGLDGLRTLENHLKWVASDQGQGLETLTDKVLRKIRYGATVASLGWRPITFPIFLVSNILNAIQDLGPVGTAKAIADFVSNRDANAKFVDDNSKRMEHRATDRDRDLMDMAKRWKGNDNFIQKYMFYIHAKADQSITYPVWLSTYKGNVEELGHTTAVDMADEAVMKVAGSGMMLDQAMIQRGTEAQKVFTWWYSWAGNMFNRAWRDGKMAGLAYDKGNVGTAIAITANAALYGWVLQAANENLWREWMRNSPHTNDEKRGKRIIQRTIMQPISYIPVIREPAEWAVGKLLHNRPEMKLPFQDAVESLGSPFLDLADTELHGKKFTEAVAEDMARGLAIGLKYPQTVNTLAFNFIDYLNGKGDLGWRDLLTRKTKE